ncbi:EAL and HDOD domain-containing protein [Rhodocyclus tenuis]|uniref:EAL and modified HD-GYP domain-containing signal transduction protein n=1 Tax=Rhodocyclus tenuis TaxID=1066 RepID=A0A840G5Z4_RHOTE|nr:HDOD domain-containing protein [Rhodocyclus tenuis]MBB4246390.1 EAL and modified HD-GYP domain-containing signal transduction protein [Rhodocyclus tenuis]
MSDVFITRQPLVNRQSRIIALRLRLHGASGDAARMLNALADVWPQGERPVFVACPDADGRLLDWNIPANATLEFPGAAFCDARAGELLAALHRQRPSLCLDYDEQAGEALAAGLAFRFIAYDAKSQTVAQLKTLAAKMQPYGIGVALNVDSEKAFKATLEAGMTAAASWFFKHPTSAPAKTLNPGQAHIIRVLNLVRKNADLREIEAALKQDVALSYKLLRYINSAGFGLSCEIQSFRHAVTILGYGKLNKWLSLLLATASKASMAPALMHTALTRARLMELLGDGLVDSQEHDNLFITGAFSLLDALLGVSMEHALEAMHLPQPISDALLGEGGLYAPFLDLAAACEGNDREALAEQAGMLGISAERLNRAQLSALAFAEAMEF